MPAVPRKVHTPTCLQIEAVECGAASLSMILSYYGKWVPLAELRQKCGVNRDGSKASKIVQAAKNLGLEAKGFSKEIAAAKEMPPPFIIFWQFNHFLVVEGFGKDKVYLNDPAAGHRSVTIEEFSTAFTGVVLQMTPGPKFEKGGRPPRLWPSVVQRLRGSFRPVLFCLIAGLLLALPGMTIPVLTSVFVDAVVVGGKADWAKSIFWLMGGAVAITLGLKALETLFLRRLRLGMSARLGGHFLQHLLDLPMGFYAQRYAGEIAGRMQHVSQAVDILTGKLAHAAIGLVTMLAYVALMACYSLPLTAVGVGFAAINFLALRMAHKTRVEASTKTAQDHGTASAVAIAGVQGIETLKATGTEDGFFAKWAGHYGKASMGHQKLEAGNQMLGVLPTLLEGLAISTVLVVGGLQVLSGQMSLGMLVAFQGLMHLFLHPVGELVHTGGMLQQLQGDLQRLDDVLKQTPDPALTPVPPADPDGPFASVAARTRLSGAIDIQKLTFGYSPLDPPLIKDFNLALRPGQRVALVGGSGSGKSTLAKVITGLYQPWSGEVLLDGVSRSQLPRPLIENTIGYVSQEVTLFEGTVRDNLTLWDRTVPDDALRRALADAAVDDVVMALPGGLDAVLKEGAVNLSGGQRQRLEIARALVNDPAILILDEATSALDTESEARVVDAVRRRGCTCVVVAHRLSTIKDCDEIVVLRFGKVAERGTHTELYAEDGFYASLVRTEEPAHA